MKTSFRFVTFILAAWVWAQPPALGAYIDPILTFERTSPKYALPNNSHPSLDELIGGLEERTLHEPDDPELWFQLGLAYADAHRIDSSVSALQKAVDLDSVHVLAWENLGINLYFDHRPEEALKAFQRAVYLGASDPEVWNSFGLILLEQNRLKESADALYQGLKLDPHSRRLWNSLGMLLDKEGKDQDAIDAVHQALQIDPKYAIGWNNLAIFQAKAGTGDPVTSLQTAVRLDPKFGVAWENLAEACTNQKKYLEAGAAAKQAIKLLPNDPNSWLFLAQSARFQESWEQLVECYHQAIDTLGLSGSFITNKHDYALAYAEYGNGCTNIGHYADADQLLQKALTYDATSPDAWADIGFLRMMEGKPQEALTATQKALAIDSKQSGAWVTLGSIYFFNLNQPAEAEEAYQKAVALQPNYGGAWLGLGRSEQLLQKREEAAQAYRKATELAPNFLEAWQHLGATASDPKESDQAFAKAILINPKDASTYGMKGAVLVQRQDWPGAEKFLRQSLALAKDSSNDWTLLSTALFKQHKYAEAADAEEMAIQYGASLSQEELATDWGCVAEAHLAQTHDKGAPEWEAALKALNHATALNPTSSVFWYETALCDKTLGQLDDAAIAQEKWKTFGGFIPRLPEINNVPSSTPASPTPSNGASPSPALLSEANTIKTLLQNHQIEAAGSLAQKETQDHPNDPLAWYDLGDVFMNDKKYEEAIPCLTKATSIDPKMGPAWFDLGNSLAYLGKFDQAIDALTNSINAMPNFPLNWLALSECYSAKGDLAGGADKVQELLQAHQDSAYGWCALGDLETTEGMPDLAREALQKAVDLQPKYAHAWNSLGLTFGKLQQPDKARECFLRATLEEPSDPEAWNNLGFVYFGAGETTKAIDAYQHALQANPQHVLALYNLVTAYAAEKEWDLARQTCDILAQVNPAQAAQLRATFPRPAEPPVPATNPGTP
jgi:tetratricopeptide (TPR) repeat protein